MPTLKDDLVTALARITELDGAITSLTAGAELHAAAIVEKDEKITELEATAATFVQTTADARDAHALVIAAKDAKITELEGKVEAGLIVIAASEGEIKDLKASATTVDAAADVKAREIAARHGVLLPAKAPGAGDQTTDGPKTDGLTGMAKARAYLDSRMPQLAIV